METKVDKRTKEYKDSIEQPVVLEQGCADAARMAIDSLRKTEPVEGVYIKDAYAKVENNPKFRRCMHCWTELPPNEDGSPKYRRVPEPCPVCIWRDA